MTPGTERAIQSLANSMIDIAKALESLAVENKPKIDPDSLGAVALWKEDVAAGNTILGFSEWVAWHQKEGDGA